jgi:hypothetical protein
VRRLGVVVAAEAAVGQTAEADTLVAVAGAERPWTGPATGRLGCFADDVPPMYFDNAGFVRLRGPRAR